MNFISHPSSSPHFKQGVGLILFSWIFFTLLIAISREVAAKTSIAMVLLFQNAISLILIIPWLIKSKCSLKTAKFKLICLRTLAGYLNFTCIFYAVQKISLVDTILLSNTAPLFIPLIIWLWRKVKLGYKLWLGILLGFVGIGFILKPDIAFLNLGMIFALGAGLCLAVSMIAQRRLVKTEPPVLILFYYFFFSTLLSFPIAFYLSPMPKTTDLLLLALIGFLSFIAQITFQKAFQYGKPSALSPFNYISVIYAAVLEWLIWNHFPDWISLLGILLVCLGSIFTIRHESDLTNGAGK